MKCFNKLSALLITTSLFFFLAACEKDDSEVLYGNTNIYMPQATVSGLRYAVPAGLDSATFNYKIDAANDKVNIILGVSRSGKQLQEAYKVDIVANVDTVNQLISTGVLSAATHLLMPASMYVLPADIAVPAGQTAATFYLSINKTVLKTYAGKKLVLAVALANPSKYTLNNAISKTIVIIDVNALKL